MTRHLFGLFVGIALLAASVAARAEHYEVFLLAGQSNMDGRGPVKDLVGPLAKWAEPQSDVLINYSNSGTRNDPILTSGGWKPLVPGYSVAPGRKVKEVPSGTFGPEVALGRTLADGMKGRHVALIKFCEGGASLQSKWHPENRNLLYDQFLEHVATSLESLTDAGHTYTIRGMAWHQGEADFALPEGEYAKLLTTLVTRVRQDLKIDDLPIVVGEVFDNGKRDHVRAGALAVSKAVPHMGFASSANLESHDDGVHFDAPGQIEMGTRMGKEMLRLLSEEKEVAKGK